MYEAAMFCDSPEKDSCPEYCDFWVNGGWSGYFVNDSPEFFAAVCRRAW